MIVYLKIFIDLIYNNGDSLHIFCVYNEKTFVMNNLSKIFSIVLY